MRFSPFKAEAATLLVATFLLLSFCSSSFGAGRFINAGTCKDMVYDDATSILYMTSGDKVLRYSTASKTLLSPFVIGGNLQGIDLSPDGKTLAVADLTYGGVGWVSSGGTAWIYLIDTQTGNKTQAIFEREYGEGGSYWVAFGSDGKVLSTNTFLGSGWVGLRQYDPASSTFKTLASVRMDARLSASADRSVIAWEESNSSDGPFGRYRVSDGNIIIRDGYDYGTSAFNYSVASNRNGTQYAIFYGGVSMCDANMIKTGKISGGTGGSPMDGVFDPTKDVIYISWSSTSKVRAYDSNTLSLIREYDLGTTLAGGRVKTSGDGKLLFAAVQNGISYMRLDNNPPTATPLTLATLEDTPINVTLAGSDPDGEPITYTVTTPPAHGQLTGTAPNLTYTPTANYNGADSFVYKVSDGEMDSSPCTVSLTVAAVNDPPLANAQKITINEEDTVNVTLTGSDVDGDLITYTIIDQPQHGTLSGTAPSLIYKSQIGYYGADSFTFKTSDAKSSSAPASVSITINPIPHVSIGKAKKLASGTLVFIESAVVTASQIEPGVSFIQSPDRSAGIKVMTNSSLTRGQVARLKGNIERVDGEWRLNNPMFSRIQSGPAVAPVFVSQRVLCNDRNETLSYRGINTTGMLIKTYGRVTAVIPGSRVVYISDGYPASDGIGPWSGIRVQFPSGITLPTQGKRIAVTGISRVGKFTLTQWGYVNGNWLPAGSVVYSPSIWIRSSADVQIF